MSLKFKFDPNQDYQLSAIASITKLFNGLSAGYGNEAAVGATEIVPNLPAYQFLNEEEIFGNLQAIQKQFNQVADSRGDESGKIIGSMFDLEIDEGLGLEQITTDSYRFPHFTIEMETGTGKTYVYLRTIQELRQKYGFRKFVIVVPSRAIYEGVIKSFDITQNHFRALYNNENTNLYQYDSSQISRVRAFANATSTSIMVITLQAFNSRVNNLYKATEKLPGELLPYEYLAATRPIVILDEPQNMESERSQEAIRTLNPLFVLRYSATHRSSPNLTYRLTPFEACRRNLVKRIAVWGVDERDELNQPFLRLKAVKKSPAGITATIATYGSTKGRTKATEVTLKQSSDLQTLTKREEHAGYVVETIHAGKKWVRFTNGITLHLNDTIGRSRVEIFREQIKQTILAHIAKQRELMDQGIKVLSLFFIDKVANYLAEDQPPLIRHLFDEEFEKLKGRYDYFRQFQAADVQAGYFASRTVKGETTFIDTRIEEDRKRKQDTEAEKEAYELIMKDKERLLSFEEPVCFIFAHSALKEGWDNPNVFQICTLNQTVSPIRKRQEIGRGLRICVNQEGDRIFDEEVNRLTIVANESYKSYAENLQREYEEEGHAPPPAAN